MFLSYIPNQEGFVLISMDVCLFSIFLYVVLQLVPIKLHHPNVYLIKVVIYRWLVDTRFGSESSEKGVPRSIIYKIVNVRYSRDNVDELG